MITKRDQDILNFIEDFKIATTEQIHRIFFKDVSYRYCAKRLEYLLEIGEVKKTRSTIDNCNAYYLSNKPVQLHHNIIRAELYSFIINTYQIMEWHNEYSFLTIRPDAFAYISDHDIIFPIFIEIHLGNSFNFDKYSILFKENDLKTLFGIMPRVLICTDRNISLPKTSPIKYKVVEVDMKGLDSLFR